MNNALNKPTIKKLAILIAATSIFTSASFFSVAADSSATEIKSRSEHSERRDHRRINPEKRMEMIIEALNLTESQVELFKLSHQPSKENRTEKHELRKQLRDLTQSTEYSEREANKIAQQMTELAQSNIVARANAQNAFYISLSEEQLVTFNSLQEKMKDRKKSQR